MRRQATSCNSLAAVLRSAFRHTPPRTPAEQTDSDSDGRGDPCDLCTGDDATGDGDGDGLCADRDFDDDDATNACTIFADGFELGDTSAWSASTP